MSSKEQILVITPVGLDGQGGIDRLNRYMVEHFREIGDAPSVRFLGSRGSWRAPFWPLYFTLALVRFVAILLRGRVDLVHIHVSTDGSAFRKCIFGWIARLFGQAYVIHFHGDIKQAYQVNPPLWVKALRNLARGARSCIVLVDAFIPAFRDKLGVSADRIRIVHNGIADIGTDATIPRPVRDTVHILFSGEVGQRKGVDLLLCALQHLSKRNSNWSCTIAGNGDLAHWEQDAQARGLGGRVRFTGWLDMARIHGLMRQADIVILPSRAEALPLSLIEGASAGAALVACDIGAVADVVLDGVNGRIVPHEGSAIAGVLDELVSRRPVLADMQRASRAIYLQRFQIRRFAAGLRTVQHEAIEEAGGGKARTAAAE